MESAFQGLPFDEPGRAQANLAAIRARVPAPIYQTLPTLLADLPDPDDALNYFERFTAAAPGDILEHLARNPAGLHYLLTIFSYSRFLSETLVQQPELIGWLDRPAERAKFSRLKSREDLLQEYARFEATALGADRPTVLARFKRREYLRIMLKDVLGITTLAETTLELSTLADVLLAKALEMVEQPLAKRYGQPTQVDASGRIVPARFAIISLGKLGGTELNYSSDIDLLYLFSGEGETTGAEAVDARISNPEFFIRLAHGVTRLISDVTPEGAVFRVDLRLRPQGKEGDLAVSLPAALDYYRRHADDWERQMLIKARYSAGDPALAREFIRAVQPVIYEKTANFEAIESIRDSRERIDRKLRAELPGGDLGRGLNLKLAPGGIRDIEFLVQCLQRLYGGTDPWVRSGGTLVALTKLFDKGHLHQRDYYRLSTAYQFFRKVEHRLQLVMGQQTHSLPVDPADRERLARRVGIASTAGLSAGEYFLKVVERHLQQVCEIHDRVIHSTAAAVSAAGEEFALAAIAVDLRAPIERPWAKLLESLQRSHPLLHASIEQAMPGGRAHKAFYRLLAAALASSERFAALEEHREQLPLAAQILESSDYLGEILIREPERLVGLADMAREPETTGQLSMDLTRTRADGLDPRLTHVIESRAGLSARMGELRDYFRDQQFRLGVRDVLGPRDIFSALAACTLLAEGVLRAGLAMACGEIAANGESLAGRFAILALGRLGMREMDIGSDADLVFICDESAASAITAWKRVAERLIQIVSSYTRAGTIFPVDPRLRPGGAEGELVQTLDYVGEYFSSRAEAWELATCLKLRPVAGDLAFGREVVERLHGALAEKPRDPARLGAELAAMRRRLEAESQPIGQDNFKTGAGGFYDIDYLLSYFQLSAPESYALGRTTLEQIEAAAARGHLSEPQARELSEAVRFLRSLDHAIRLVTGRAAAGLPERLHWEPVARLVSEFTKRRVSPATLPGELKRMRGGIRVLYEEVLSHPISLSRNP